MTRKFGGRRRGEGAFGFIVSLLLLVAVIISCIKLLPVAAHRGVVTDAMNEAANFGGAKTMDKIQFDVYRRARESRIPLKLENIKVVRDGDYIVITAKYTETVDLFGKQLSFTFDKKVEKPVF